MVWYYDMVVVLAVLGSVTDAEKERNKIDLNDLLQNNTNKPWRWILHKQELLPGLV